MFSKRDLLSTFGQNYMKSRKDTHARQLTIAPLRATTSPTHSSACRGASEADVSARDARICCELMLPSGQEKGRRSDHISSFVRSSETGCGVFCA